MITQEEFETWLALQRGSRRVYGRGASLSCPISLAAQDILGVPDVWSADGLVCHYRPLGARFGVPSSPQPWMKRVQDACDAAWKFDGREPLRLGQLRLTIARALKEE